MPAACVVWKKNVLQVTATMCGESKWQRSRLVIVKNAITDTSNQVSTEVGLPLVNFVCDLHTHWLVPHGRACGEVVADVPTVDPERVVLPRKKLQKGTFPDPMAATGRELQVETWFSQRCHFSRPPWINFPLAYGSRQVY